MWSKAEAALETTTTLQGRKRVSQAIPRFNQQLHNTITETTTQLSKSLTSENWVNMCPPHLKFTEIQYYGAYSSVIGCLDCYSGTMCEDCYCTQFL